MSDNGYWDEETDRAYWDYCGQIEAEIREEECRDTDSVSRKDVLNHLGDLFTLCSETGSITERDLEIFEKIIKSLSPVPHEMTAREFFKSLHHMCSTMMACVDCPLLGACKSVTQWTTEDVIAAVEKWAREHPERSEE